MTITRGRPLPLVGLIVVLGGAGAQGASPEPPPDACARLTRAEAEQVLPSSLKIVNPTMTAVQRPAGGLAIVTRSGLLNVAPLGMKNCAA